MPGRNPNASPHEAPAREVAPAVVVVSPDALAALIEAAVRRALDERASTEPAAEWLDAKAVAALLGVSTRQVAKLAKRAELPSTRVGRLLRVRRVDVDAYLERGA